MTDDSEATVLNMLTTVDNPYDPFTQFEQWHAWDTASGYHSLSLLGRIVVSSIDLSDADQAVAVQQAIEEICQENVSGMHRKVSLLKKETKSETETVTTT